MLQRQRTLKKEATPFVVVNERDKLIRELAFNPLLFPDGRGF